MSKTLDLTDRKFGRLIAKKIVGSNKYKYKLWECICKCGNKKIVSSICLVQNYTKSCGCRNPLKKTHGMSKSVEYRAWAGLIDRVENKKADHAKRYKYRGIKVCNRWRNSFEAFFADMGKRPAKNYSIDRKNNDTGYTCGKCQQCLKNNWTSNCRWATKETQMSNTCQNHFITYQGITLTRAQWCGSSETKEYRKVRTRQNRGWSDEQALKDIQSVAAIVKAAQSQTNKTS